MAKTVFVIYGRDSRAHAELVKFIRAVGLEELAFESIANELGPRPFIADIVTTGIEKANAVIALFTPDEHAVLYDPSSGTSLDHEEGGSRWQARPNVMFEAGVAYGRSGREPIMTVLGSDVSLFSDVGGVHFIRLDNRNAKRQLFNRLSAIVGPLEPRVRNWETSTVSGDFSSCVRRRWRSFDEVEDLQHYLANRQVRGKRAVSRLEVITTIVLADVDRDWSRVDARAFMEEVKTRYGEACTDSAYWWMIVYGFLQFDNIEDWGTIKDATWDDSVDQARLAARGAALIERLRALAIRRLPDKALQPPSRTGRKTKSNGRARAARG